MTSLDRTSFTPAALDASWAAPAQRLGSPLGSSTVGGVAGSGQLPSAWLGDAALSGTVLRAEVEPDARGLDVSGHAARVLGALLADQR